MYWTTPSGTRYQTGSPRAPLPRLAGRDEGHLVEAEAARHLAGGHQVAVVDRVERATHDPEPVRRHEDERRAAHPCKGASSKIADVGGRGPPQLRDVAKLPLF